MSLKTIKQWQRCPQNTSTRILSVDNTVTCGNCQVRTSAGPDKNVVLCLNGTVAKFFCVSCWDEEEWDCPHCGCVPDDIHVIGCETCGQWVHQDCQRHIDTLAGYRCDSCQMSNVTTLKETIFNECQDKNQKNQK